ncbi:metal-dependent hydrolase [Candidatus Woesebacteria bacterium]|nr:metal-dependent hydrolase [Candidatus Woesebacteria bacterium]
MTFPSHLLAGLIIGKITGDLPTAIAGSMIIDLDHTISFFRHGVLFKPRQLYGVMRDEIDHRGDQRHFLHSIFSWLVISILLLLINFDFGLVFSIAYFFHLVFDSLDTVGFYPFFPFTKFVLKGSIKYSSNKEIIFDIYLIIILITLFFIK